jgi:hypothetical protein
MKFSMNCIISDIPKHLKNFRIWGRPLQSYGLVLKELPIQSLSIMKVILDNVKKSIKKLSNIKLSNLLIVLEINEIWIYQNQFV